MGLIGIFGCGSGRGLYIDAIPKFVRMKFRKNTKHLNSAIS
jgi:hypothetical protein